MVWFVIGVVVVLGCAYLLDRRDRQGTTRMPSVRSRHGMSGGDQGNSSRMGYGAGGYDGGIGGDGSS